MKLQFKLIFWFLSIGYAPMIMLSGIKLDSQNWWHLGLFFIMIAGWFLGLMSTIMHASNKRFWQSQKKLDEAIKYNLEQGDVYAREATKLIKAARKYGGEQEEARETA